ncbi:hypothetical protein BKA56DRAFT_621180 [Ilyonectria sp. MPI-CAGE-AT-0026]|nr:hypothetical protein BKA56DRAFT_621180 [Ilyonectria sp. MPI-CAGE-AT-0026]
MSSLATRELKIGSGSSNYVFASSLPDEHINLRWFNDTALAICGTKCYFRDKASDLRIAKLKGRWGFSGLQSAPVCSNPFTQEPRGLLCCQQDAPDVDLFKGPRRRTRASVSSVSSNSVESVCVGGHGAEPQEAQAGVDASMACLSTSRHREADGCKLHNLSNLQCLLVRAS